MVQTSSWVFQNQLYLSVLYCKNYFQVYHMCFASNKFSKVPDKCDKLMFKNLYKFISICENIHLIFRLLRRWPHGHHLDKLLRNFCCCINIFLCCRKIVKPLRCLLANYYTPLVQILFKWWHIYFQKMPILSSQEYGLLDYSFIDFNLDDDDTLKASIRMFLDLNLVDKFRINYEVSTLKFFFI